MSALPMVSDQRQVRAPARVVDLALVLEGQTPRTISASSTTTSAR